MINPRLWQHEKNIQEIFTRFSHILIYYENAIRIFIYLYIYIFLPEEIEFEFIHFTIPLPRSFIFFD